MKSSMFSFIFWFIPKSFIFGHENNFVSRSCLNTFQTYPVIELSEGFPFSGLEHININSGPWNDDLDRFFFRGLGFVNDPRRGEVLNRTRAAGGISRGLMWANAGLQQLHLPSDSAQVVRGYITVEYPNLKDLKTRLESNSIPFSVDFDILSNKEYIKTECPNGNKFHLFEQQREVGKTWFGPLPYIEPSLDHALPGGLADGLGISQVHFYVPRDTAKSICGFYEYFFKASPQLISKNKTQVCRVHMGFHQYIEYEETDNPLPEYDGHHIAVYVTDFLEIYQRLVEYDLHWDNPRFPQFSYRTMDDVILHNEYRVKDIIDMDTNETVYQLEHEIRSLRHPSYCCKWIFE